MASFEKMSPISLASSAMQTLRAKILAGELKAGEWLPAERDMAEQMGISRSSLHQAILELEYQGFVSIVPRRGTIICDFRKYPTPQSLEALMCNDSLELDYSIFSDMMDFRLWLESECARLACTHIYKSTFDEMQEIVSQLTKPGVDLTDLIYSFHYKLTQASGNSLYSMVFRGFEAVLRTSIEHHYSVRADDIRESAEMRKRLLELIRAGDEKGASECVCAIIKQGITVLEERYSEK